MLLATKYFKVKQQRGETIVEVLLCLVIITFILALAYAVTSQNRRQIQDVNERGQALQLAETQVEFLRNYTGPAITNGQCLTSTTNPPSTPSTSPQVPDDCDVSPNSNATDCASPFCYTLSINKVGSSAYEVNVSWPSADKGIATVTLDYQPS